MSSEAQSSRPANAAVGWSAGGSLAGYNLYQFAERGSEGLIYLMVVFTPWAFGCTNTRVLPNWSIFGATQVWYIWTMNFAGYLLGLFLLLKVGSRWLGGYQPPRWGNHPGDPANDAAANRLLPRIITPALAIVTLSIVVYCLISAANARADYRPNLFRFDYFKNYIPWLPHSYDASSSWIAFWNYLGLAGAFWGLRDWLMGKTLAEIRAERKAGSGEKNGRIVLLPERLRRLLWVLSINGALLGLEGIAQRLSGTNKLLWYLPTRLNRDAIAQFGPYAYRSNGAQYFNLLWPTTLAFWWTLRRSAIFTAAHTNQPVQRRHHLLLPMVVIMAVCPLISASRGGAIIAVMMIPIATLILLTALKRAHGATKLGLFITATATLCIGFGIGGEKLGERMKDFNSLTVREQMYATARPMAEEYPWFGTGPNTFNLLFQFYRSSEDEYWPAQLHNDWLETRITFGRIGSALIAATFLIVAARRFAPGGMQTGWRFAALIWLGLVGCLAHARFDFPFQIYSILFLFLVLCAILSNLSRPAER